MIILGIETSCDDTGISILKASENKTPDFEILANIISSQIEIHKKYGGVYPTMARREHEKNLTPVLEKALREAKLLANTKHPPSLKLRRANETLEEIFEREPKLLKNLEKFLRKYEKPKIDAIAITIGPGLDPCLWTGVNFARALSYYWNIPIIPINHIEAHILVNLLSPRKKTKRKTNTDSNDRQNLCFPAICLVVSGGHTQLMLMKGIGKYKILGETRDDAAGECFDKTARILGLEYPGGPAIAEIASSLPCGVAPRNDGVDVKLPRPMIYSKDYDFSFSGLKTAVLYEFKKRPKKIQKDKKYIQAMCAEIQQSIIDVLIKKTLRAAQDYKAKTIILGGGVCANEELRQQFNNQLSLINKRAVEVKPQQPDERGVEVKPQQLDNQLSFWVPPKILCTDNGLMTAMTGFYHRNNKTKNWKKIQVNANLRISC